MNTLQPGIHIPASLNDRLTAFMEQTDISFADVVVSALASYLGCTEEISLTDRTASVEAKVAQLDALVKNK